MSLAQTVQAQQLSSEQVAAVMAVVTNLLISDRDEPIAAPSGVPIELSVGDLEAGPYSVTGQQQVFGQFDLQQGGVEFCF